MPIHQVPDPMFHLFFAIISFFAVQDDAGSLPAPSAVWERLRPNLLNQYEPTDLMKGYTYDLTSIVEEFDGKNRLKQTQRLEYEVYNFNRGPFRKLVRRNGADVSGKKLQKENEALESFAKQPPGIQEWTRNRWLKQLPEIINDLPNAFDIVIAGRKMLNGRSTLLVEFKPKQKPKPRTEIGRVLFPKTDGMAWVDEQDARLQRLEVHYLGDVKLGFGLLLNISKDSEQELEWTKVNGEVWLPVRYEVRIKGRIMLAKGLNLRILNQYSEYKKFSSDVRIDVP
jgi:hypothetical protein